MDIEGDFWYRTRTEDDVRLAVLTKLDFNVYAASAVIMGDDREL